MEAYFLRFCMFHVKHRRNAEGRSKTGVKPVINGSGKKRNPYSAWQQTVSRETVGNAILRVQESHVSRETQTILRANR